MSQLRLNPLTGRWVAVAVERSMRPVDFAPRRVPVESDPTRPCPFCPGNEDQLLPALKTYGSNDQWQVLVVPNLYPAFDGHEPMAVTNLGPVHTQATASGMHEVLVLTPDHQSDWADFDDLQAGLAMTAIRDRMEDHARHSTIRYTQAIVNRGREAGASLDHPHGQVLGIPFVPGELTEELEAFVRFTGSCLLCTTIDAEVDAGHRIVYEDERVVALCPFWSGAPYEMLIIPVDHGPHLARARPDDIAAVGRALRTCVGRLRRCVGDFSYNLVFHTAPHHLRDDGFHWHVHVVPRLTSVAGFEQGTGVMINIVAPETAARHLIATD